MSEGPPARAFRRWRLRWHLVFLVLVAVAPVLVFAGLLVVRIHDNERKRVERAVRDTARALVIAVDGELARTTTAVQALAASRHLERDDLRAFYAEAGRVLPTQAGWLTVVLSDPEGHQLMNLLRPFGSRLPDIVDRESARRAVETRAPVVGGVVFGPFTGQPGFVVCVPVIRAQRVRYVISAVVSTDAVQALLGRQDLPREWIGSILDAQGDHVARTRDPEHHLGHRASSELLAAVTKTPEAWIASHTVQGASVYGAYSRSPESGWTVAFGIPTEVLDAPLRRSLAALIAGGVLLAMSGVGAAGVLARRVARPVVALGQAAHLLGTRPEERLAIAPSRVAEVDAALEAVDRARELLQHRGAERDAVETALREANQQLQALVENSPLGITVVDADGIVRLWNPAAERIFGWSAREAVGRLHPIVPGERLGEYLANVRATLDGRRLVAVEARRVRRDGTAVDVSISTAALHDAGGQARLVIGVVEDITERKQAEAERIELLRRAETARTEAERRRREAEVLAAIAQTLNDALDVDTVLRRVVDGAKLLSDSDTASIALRLPETEAVAVRYRAESSAPVAEGAQSAPDEVVAGEVLAVGRAVRVEDGTATRLAVPIKIGGRVEGVLQVANTALGRAFDDRDEAMLVRLAAHAAVAIRNVHLFFGEQHARREAEAATRAKDEFLAVLSHELRTPLTAMLGWVRMLRTARLAETQRARALESIERNTRVQAQLINDLLDVSRIVAGKLQLDRFPVPLAPVVEEALESLRGEAAAKGIDLEMMLDERAGPVLGDPVRLQQIVVNLVANALKFTPGGGRVAVRLTRGERRARIVVSDTGQGIAPALLPHIFDRFRQADSSATRPKGGLGLGLAIVRHITELHGGTVTVESAGPQQGTTFTVELPLLAHVVADSEVSAARVGHHPEAARGPLAGVHVLVVEDHPDTAAFIATVLERAGAVVRVAHSLREALARLDDARADVLVSDIGMPDGDGHQLVQRVRAGERATGRRPMAAVAVTAYASSEDRRRALAAGFHAHVAKPLDPQVFVDTVAKLVARV